MKFDFLSWKKKRTRMIEKFLAVFFSPSSLVLAQHKIISPPAPRASLSHDTLHLFLLQLPYFSLGIPVFFIQDAANLGVRPCWELKDKRPSFQSCLCGPSKPEETLPESFPFSFLNFSAVLRFWSRLSERQRIPPVPVMFNESCWFSPSLSVL